MLHPKEGEDCLEFKWGKKKGVGKNKDIQFYESFTYDGEEYFLYDCVYMYHEDGQDEPDIGKIIKIYEKMPNSEMIVKVVWFFRSGDLHNWLRHEEPLENEIFLASGEGTGLYNFNPLESIAGKCNVACTTKDRRNPRASKLEVERADFIFYRCFDVERCRVLDEFPEKIAGINVECFFNRRNGLKRRAETELVLGKRVQNELAEGESSGKASEDLPLKKRKLLLPESPPAVSSLIGQNGGLSKEVNFNEKAIKISGGTSSHLAHDNGVKTDRQDSVIPKSPNTDKRRWFKQLPWEERMIRAHGQGTLVLLDNLDPTYTSTEIEKIVWQAFKQKVEAKMIERGSFSSPHYGKAFVIFRTKDAAELVISELRRRCLILQDGRPLVACRQAPTVSEKQTNFVGHLVMEKSKRQREDTGRAVSTSHCAQPNTLEYAMAMEWRLLQDRSDIWWKTLHKEHALEMEKVWSQLQIEYSYVGQKFLTQESFSFM